MESPEEVMGHHQLVKKKRTKRQRLLLRTTTTSSSSGGGDAGNNPTSSASSSAGNVTEEEEDMAHCLILLARGPITTTTNNNNNRRQAEPGLHHPYECKTCNKSFPSFQALGGHRASHKKPRLAPSSSSDENTKHPIFAVAAEDETSLSLSTAIPTTQFNNTNNIKSSRVHCCSICGSEFSSGQALGGHMRRHRQIPGPESQEHAKKVLSLDLNLPAPSDDDREFVKPSLPPLPPPTAAAFVFSAAALVDCHY
ncbi:Zinc finger protein ZAT5 [Acorus gramineus]|uniref:Zinc finger protein ZAT5 n=1 Tax=Acorus gramineus TaxID=55184 RepID=A0AAV9ART1_ACOGR|nr:Zinc finger protein ZAT5 [Acorus gramineus]